MMAGISTPHSLFEASKRERAVEPSKRKNAWRGTCAVAQVRLNTGAVLAKCHQFSSLLPARAGLIPRVSGPRADTRAVIAGGHRKARPPSPADATLERKWKKKQGVSQTSHPPPAPRRGQKLSWNPTDNPTARRFFLLDRARPVLFLARPNGAPQEPSKAVPVGRGGAREQAQFSPIGGNGAKRTLRRRQWGRNNFP